VPAKIIEPFKIKVFTFWLINPKLADAQLPPLSVDLNTPPFVPAKMLFPDTISELIF